MTHGGVNGAVVVGHFERFAILCYGWDVREGVVLVASVPILIRRECTWLVGSLAGNVVATCDVRSGHSLFTPFWVRMTSLG